jgi:hypothetical protein
MTGPALSAESLENLQRQITPLQATLDRFAVEIQRLRTHTVSQLAAGEHPEHLDQFRTPEAQRLFLEVRRAAALARTPEQVLQVWSLLLRAMDLEDIATACVAFLVLTVCAPLTALTVAPVVAPVPSMSHLGTGQVHAHAPPVCTSTPNTCVMQT